MKARLLLLGLFVPLFATAALTATAQQCPLVNCDCEAISDAHWRDVCTAHESKVIEDCVANQGRPKSYCGLHGPAAFPVATSIQPDKNAAIAENNDPSITQKLIATQSWSLDDSFNVLKARERAKQYGDAIQIASLLERDLERLYQLYRQADAAYKRLSQEKEGRALLDSYARTMFDRATSLQDYSVSLWQNSAAADSDRSQKAFRALAFKLSRLGAAVYEYSGDLYGLAGMHAKSAELWQAAAEVAKMLEKWESETENKAQHLAFYQAQAAARWHRATFQLLQAGHNDAVAAALARAQSGDAESTSDVADTSHSDHEAADDARAIKRGSH